MNVRITPTDIGGIIKTPASKSQAHRMLICAAFADKPTDILCKESSNDIDATAACLKALGTIIDYDKETGIFHVVPGNAPESAVIDCGESGSTLRFLLPVVCALGVKTHIVMHGRLPERPLSPLWEELEAHGVILTKNPDGTVDTEGKLKAGVYTLRADISSQFISGMLFAMPLIDGGCGPESDNRSSLHLTGNVESINYIYMTIAALKLFGVSVKWDENVLSTGSYQDMQKDGNICSESCAYRSPGQTEVEGDWSNGAFWIIASMISKKKLEVLNLNPDSVQGDKAVMKVKDMILNKKSGTEAGNCDGSCAEENNGEARAVVDAHDIPDLVPILSVLAALTKGTTQFIHAERLRIKESDRIKAVINMLTAVGAKAEETKDGLIVYGQERLRGGSIDSVNDHRIAMSGAVLSVGCENEVLIKGAECVKKSYPDFWKDFEKLGGRILIEAE